MNIPLHRLTSAQVKVWLMGGELQRQQAENLRRRYPGGVGVLSPTQCLFAYVRPDGSVQSLTPPFRRYLISEIANRPTLEQCPCAEYFDPESGGPWKLRARDGEHHPICQYKPTSMTVFNLLMRAHREENAKRPDDMRRAEERALGVRGEKTRVTLR